MPKTWPRAESATRLPSQRLQVRTAPLPAIVCTRRSLLVQRTRVEAALGSLAAEDQPNVKQVHPQLTGPEQFNKRRRLLALANSSNRRVAPASRSGSISDREKEVIMGVASSKYTHIDLFHNLRHANLI
jgi:hypothetical protein